MKYLFIATFIFVLACDPCRECDTFLYEPTLTLKFINQDSLNNLNDSIGKNNLRNEILSDSIIWLEDTLHFLVDTLIFMRDSIENGGDYDTTSVFDSIQEYDAELQKQSTESNSLEILNSEMSAVKSVINSGSVEVTRIENLNESFVVDIEEDSLTAFSIPLPYSAVQTRYEIEIADFIGTVDFSLRFDTTVDIRRNVLIRPDSIFITDFENFTKFDTCKVNCSDGQAVFTLYF